MARKSLIGWTKALLAAAIVVGGTISANAQYAYCSPHGEMIAKLGEKFQEKRFALGTIGEMAVMELFVGDKGTWTVLVTDVSGKSCILAAGDNWESTVILSGTDA